MPEQPYVILEEEEGLATVTMNRGEKRNPLSTAMMTALIDTFEKLGRRSEIRAVILAGEGTIEVKHLSAIFQSGGSVPASVTVIPDSPASDGDQVRFSIGTTVEEAEKGLILRTLEHTKNNKTRAAEILGISLKTLHNKLKEYGSKEAGAIA